MRGDWFDFEGDHIPRLKPGVPQWVRIAGYLLAAGGGFGAGTSAVLPSMIRRAGGALASDVAAQAAELRQGQATTDKQVADHVAAINKRLDASEKQAQYMARQLRDIQRVVHVTKRAVANEQ
jgi:hypothetical protein